MSCRTIIIYDIENIKVPEKGKESYRAKNVDLKKISLYIRNRFPSLYTKEVAFVKTTNTSKAKSRKMEAFVDFLKRNWFQVKTKAPKRKLVTGIHNGIDYVHEYEQSDMDSMIIEEILRATDVFDHIVILSGDGDMASSLKYAKRIGKEITVIAHEENMSKQLKTLDHIFIHEIMEDR